MASLDPRTKTEQLRERGEKWDEDGNPVVRYVPLFKQHLDNTGLVQDNEISRSLTVVTAQLLRLLWSYGCPMYQIYGCVRICHHAEREPMQGERYFGRHYFYDFTLYGALSVDSDKLLEAWFDVFKVCYKENLGEDIATKLFHLYPCIYMQHNKNHETLLHFAMKYLPDGYLADHAIGTCSHFANKKDKWGRLPFHYACWSNTHKSCSTLAELLSHYPAALGTYAHKPAIQEYDDIISDSWLDYVRQDPLEPNAEAINMLKMIMNNWPAAVLLENNNQYRLPLNFRYTIFENRGYGKLIEQMELEVSNAVAELAINDFFGSEAKKKAQQVRSKKNVCDGTHDTCEFKHLLPTTGILPVDNSQLTKEQKTLHRVQHRILDCVTALKKLAIWKHGPEHTLPTHLQNRINILCRINRAGDRTAASYFGLINRQSTTDVLAHAQEDLPLLHYFVQTFRAKQEFMAFDPNQARSMLADTTWRRTQFKESLKKAVKQCKANKPGNEGLKKVLGIEQPSNQLKPPPNAAAGVVAEDAGANEEESRESEEMEYSENC